MSPGPRWNDGALRRSQRPFAEVGKNLRADGGISRLFLCGVLAWVGLSIAGCSTEDDSIPVAAPPGNVASVTFLQQSQSSSPIASGATLVTRELSAGGGELRLGEIHVRFESGTLSSTTTFTLTRFEGQSVSFSVEPSAVVLAKPVKISIDHLDDKTTRVGFDGLSFFRHESSGWLMMPSSASAAKIEASSSVLGEFVVGSADSTGIQFLEWLSGPGFKTAWIEASRGGDVEYGRFKLRLPANALAQDTYITVRDPGDGYVTCWLEPHGIEFQLPVRLEVDLKGLNYAPYEDWTVFWLHDGPNVWENQYGTFDRDRIRVDLMHFSVYRPGRAGW